jgi:tRNA 5-methylaminomethyl-2-thiouridine biosynthesis bifunctional protein
MAQMRRRAMSHPQLKKISIVGSGLAGAACASAFAHAGYSVTVYEQAATPAAGASGVPIALFAPSVSADDAPHSRLLRRGVHLLLHELHRLTNAGLLTEGVDWAMTGVLERCIRGDKKLPSVWLEPQDPIGLQSRVSGEPYPARPAGHPLEIFHGAAGWVNPKRLISSWLAHPHIELKTQTRVDDVVGLNADAVVVACGYQSPDLLPALTGALQSIRGQVEWGTESVCADLVEATYPVNGMGHFIQSPSIWVAGATFQRDEMDLIPRTKDVDKNFEKLAILLPELVKPDLDRLRAESMSWVGVRTAQKNRQPLVRKIEVPARLNVWVCTGLGSRGLSLVALCAQDVLSAVLGSSL